MRYKAIPIIETAPTVQYPNIIRYRSTVLYPGIPLDERDTFIRTVRGDRLDKIAYKYYKNPELWWVLSIANPDLPNDSLYPTLGFQLRIPFDLPRILNEFAKFNS